MMSIEQLREHIDALKAPLNGDEQARADDQALTQLYAKVARTPEGSIVFHDLITRMCKWGQLPKTDIDVVLQSMGSLIARRIGIISREVTQSEFDRLLALPREKE